MTDDKQGPGSRPGAEPGGVAVSVVICTYNPEERIFSRVLNAVQALEREGGVAVECVIVDNNSTVGIQNLAYVQDFLRSCPDTRVITEARQGLTFARLAGIRATSGNTIVVIDDDNVPETRYIKVAKQCVDDYPSVAVWGAGHIGVDLLDRVPARLVDRVRKAHNEKSHDSIEYGCVPGGWQAFYPIGMGQVIRRDVAERYRRAVETGILSATDRQGASLASGGDIQIVWEALKMGFAAGVHPELRLRHLIPARRVETGYVKRLVFGCASSYWPALVESFPSKRAEAQRYIPTAGAIVSNLWGLTWRSLVGRQTRFLPWEIANVMGLACGRLRAAGQGPGHWAFRFSRLLGLE